MTVNSISVGCAIGTYYTPFTSETYLGLWNDKFSISSS